MTTIRLAITARNEERAIACCLRSVLRSVERAEARYPWRFDVTVVADAYPEQAEQVWKFYRDSVSGGGSLLNLTPVKPVPPPPLDPTGKIKP